MSSSVLDISDIESTQLATVGGKAAGLGELSRIDGVSVPPGFCVTTVAFGHALADLTIDDQLDRLAGLHPGDRETIAELSADVRSRIEATTIGPALVDEIIEALGRHGGDAPYAVRSSATAEDLPTASFAGQQDSYLDVVGAAAIVHHVGRCWASLFTERAVTYRLRNGFDHRRVRMAVVVQRMADARTSGVLFTADPMNGDRTVSAVEAMFGPGEALVSGLVTPDHFTVRDRRIVSTTFQRERPTLTDPEVVGLTDLGRRVEAHFGAPQDIEWCLVDDSFEIVQSRPITTLFPIPVRDDDDRHVYVSVGHGQMMTDAMKPLGLSMWKLMALPPMHEAAGRLFVDVTMGLAAPATRVAILGALGKGDPLIGDALQNIVRRDGFLPSVPEPTDAPAGPQTGVSPDPIATDPTIVADLVAAREASVVALRAAIAGKTGADLLDFVLADIQSLKRVVFEPRSHQVIMGGMDATWWLNDHLEEWLGETNAADTLSQSVANNVTSEMGLALLDVADVVRPHPEVVAFLHGVEHDGFLDEMGALDGGAEVAAALRAFLDRYGMRCVGEIDITRPRWAERPTALVPALLGNVEHAEPGAGGRRVEQGRREATAKAAEVLARLRALPDGDLKAEETERMIDRVRTFNGFREYPKYFIVSCFFVYKQALMAEAERLVAAGALRERDDVFFLTFQELHDVTRGHAVDHRLVDDRVAAFGRYERLTPPRVLTSDGEVVAGVYRRENVPDGALVGLPVSSGTIEGRARVVRDIEDADLEPGDILVTGFTDPSWSPLFVSIAGLVTEVGGLMTHGAVIAREYGLPAVVGVEGATRLIEDGRRIRVHGTDGYVELLGE